MIAAPLKQGWRGCGNSHVAHFRDQMIAAPLKLHYSGRHQSAEGGFLRSDDRGSIEAVGTPTALRSHAYFRDQMIAAPLKQQFRESAGRIFDAISAIR